MAEENKNKKKDEEDKAKKAKEFELTLDTYGEAHKAGNVSVMETNRVKLLTLAGLSSKSTAANTPAG